MLTLFSFPPIFRIERYSEGNIDEPNTLAPGLLHTATQASVRAGPR